MDAPGAVGVSLRTELSRRTFWTLSAWRDKDALGAFTRSDYHRGVMVSTDAGWPVPTPIPEPRATRPRPDRSGTTRARPAGAGAWGRGTSGEPHAPHAPQLAVGVV